MRRQRVREKYENRLQYTYKNAVKESKVHYIVHNKNIHAARTKIIANRKERVRKREREREREREDTVCEGDSNKKKMRDREKESNQNFDRYTPPHQATRRWQPRNTGD